MVTKRDSNGSTLHLSAGPPRLQQEKGSGCSNHVHERKHARHHSSRMARRQLYRCCCVIMHMPQRNASVRRRLHVPYKYAHPAPRVSSCSKHRTKRFGSTGSAPRNSRQGVASCTWPPGCHRSQRQSPLGRSHSSRSTPRPCFYGPL